MRMCIGEDVHNIYKVFIVALPDNNDEYIKVSYLPVLCINGTFYYNDNTAEYLNDYETLKKALTPEWARKNICGYRDDMKLSVAYGFTDYYGGKNADKYNEKLRTKLSSLTTYEYRNSKWR